MSANQPIEILTTVKILEQKKNRLYSGDIMKKSKSQNFIDYNIQCPKCKKFGMRRKQRFGNGPIKMSEKCEVILEIVRCANCGFIQQKEFPIERRDSTFIFR